MGTLRTARCPRCGVVATMIPLVFGYPSGETFAAAERGKVALGGCIVGAADPTHQCAACGGEVIVDEPLIEGADWLSE